MQKSITYLVIIMFASLLVACDRKQEEPKKTAPAATSSVSPQASNTNAARPNINLLEGKLRFTLPGEMADKSDKLSTQSSNMHVYADKTGQKAIIIIIGEPTSETLETLAQRLQQQQRSRDPQLQVVKNSAMTITNQPVWRLDSVISANGLTNWSTVILAKINDKLVTFQISLPVEDQIKAQSEANALIDTLLLN